MSSSDSDIDSSSSESFSSIQADFERLSEMLHNFASGVDTIETNLIKMQKPIENLELNQLMDVKYLENSSFRNQTFLLKESGFSGFAKDKRYRFKDICAVLRNYLFTNNLIQADGSVMLNDHLKKIFDLNDMRVEYLDLIARLKHVLV